MDYNLVFTCTTLRRSTDELGQFIALSVYLCVELDANDTNGIPSPTHSFTLGLNHSFSANPPYRTLSFFSFRFHHMDFPDCLLLLLAYPSFYFLVFLFLHFLVVRSVR